MKKKETKMVKLLYACKRKGLDIEQIYYEDVKSNSQNYSERQEEDIPTVNKVSLNYPTLALKNLRQMQEGHYQDGEGYLEDSDCIESKSVAESDVYEKYSNYDHCENNIQKPNLDPILQDQLRLNLSQLNQPKQSFPIDFVIHDQKLQVKQTGSKILKPKLQGLALNLNCIKKDEDEEKFKGFHEEFMSRMDEFSVSWRQAALKERKIP